MDILLLSTGLFISGYIINKGPKNPRHSVKPDKDEYDLTVGENIYRSEEIEKQKKELQGKLNSRYEEAKKEGSNLIIPNTSLWRDSSVESWDRIAIDDNNVNASYVSELNKDIVDTKKNLPTLQQEKSSLTGKPIETFHSNMLPYYSQRSNNQNSFIERFQTGDETIGIKPVKKESGPLFEPRPQDIYAKLGSFEKEEDRYKPVLNFNNINPFKNWFEKPLITSKVAIPGDTVADYRPEVKTIDELRIKERPILEQRQNHGSLEYTYADIGKVSKNTPDTHFENNYYGLPTSNIQKPIFERKEEKTKRKEITLEDYKHIPQSFIKKPKDISSEVKLVDKTIKNSFSFNKSVPIPKPSLRDGYVPSDTRRDVPENLYLSQVQPLTQKPVNVSSLQRDTKQETLYNNTSFTHITGPQAPGNYKNTETFIPKFTNKEYNIVNNYLPPANSIRKEGSYKEKKIQRTKRKENFGIYTPAGSSINKPMSPQEKGEIRKGHKIKEETYRVNIGSFPKHYQKLGEYRFTNKRSTSDKERFDQGIDVIKEQLLNNDLINNQFSKFTSKE